MKLLLDTHIWIWSLAEPKQLSRRVHQELKDRNNELWLSPVSTWEVLLLHAKGRIQLQGGAREWVTKATAYMREAPLTHEIVAAAQELPTFASGSGRSFPGCHGGGAWPYPGDCRSTTARSRNHSHFGKPLSDWNADR